MSSWRRSLYSQRLSNEKFNLQIQEFYLEIKENQIKNEGKSKLQHYKILKNQLSNTRMKNDRNSKSSKLNQWQSFKYHDLILNSNLPPKPQVP